MKHLVPILAGVMIVSLVYVLATRALRRFVTRAPDPRPQPAFDMAELQTMLDDGLVSQEEFERLKAMMLAQRAQAGASQKSTGFEVIPTARAYEPPRPD